MARTSEARTEKQGPGWLQDHLPLAASMVYFILLGIKLLAAAGLNPASALGLLSAGTTTVALGMLISDLNTYAYLMLVASALWLQRNSEGDDQPILFGFMIAVALASGFLTMFLTHLALLGPILAGPLLGWFFRRRAISRNENHGSWRAVASMVALLLTLQVLTPRMWLPQERLSLADDDQSVLGYVVEDEGRWLTVLEAEARVVRQVEAEDIETRAIYYAPRPRSIWSFRLADLVAIARTDSEARSECLLDE